MSSSNRIPHPRSRIIMAPVSYVKTQPTVFLSGSIDTPPATWQHKLSTQLSLYPIQILNPHRPDWDSTWVESETDPKFVQQTNWELQGMEDADTVAVFFGKLAKAPISMMEMGLWVRSEAGKGKLIVCCQEGFWKEGNVRILCAKYGVRVVGSVEELGDEILTLLREKDLLAADTGFMGNKKGELGEAVLGILKDKELLGENKGLLKGE